MVNLIGRVPDETSILQIEGAHLHLYGKSSRAGRKLGHVTVFARSHNALKQQIEIIGKLVNE
jgi:5-(carboxyamino)imidazole ribonucleotide synthase